MRKISAHYFFGLTVKRELTLWAVLVCRELKSAKILAPRWEEGGYTRPKLRKQSRGIPARSPRIKRVELTMIRKFSGRVSVWDANFDLMGRNPLIMASIGDEDFFHEVTKTEIDGDVYMDIGGERIEGVIRYDRGSETPELSIGGRDILAFINQFAEQEMQVWLSDKPFRASQISKMGDFYADRDEWDKAMTYFRESMSLETQDPEHIFKYIQCVVGAEKVAEVGVDAMLRLTQQAIDLRPVTETYFILVSMRAAIYDGLGKTEEAKRERELLGNIPSSTAENLRDRILEEEEKRAGRRSDFDRPYNENEDATDFDARL